MTARTDGPPVESPGGYTEHWCSGSTAAFQAVNAGSNPVCSSSGDASLFLPLGVLSHSQLTAGKDRTAGLAMFPAVNTARQVAAGGVITPRQGRSSRSSATKESSYDRNHLQSAAHSMQRLSGPISGLLRPLPEAGISGLAGRDGPDSESQAGLSKPGVGKPGNGSRQLSETEEGQITAAG